VKKTGWRELLYKRSGGKVGGGVKRLPRSGKRGNTNKGERKVDRFELSGVGKYKRLKTYGEKWLKRKLSSSPQANHRT